MAGHSRSKNGVASLAYVPAIPLRGARCLPCGDARDKPGHDGEGLYPHSSLLASFAPAAIASSFAHMIDGWTRR